MYVHYLYTLFKITQAWSVAEVSFSLLLLHYLARKTDVHVTSGWNRLQALDGGGFKVGGDKSSPFCVDVNTELGYVWFLI